VCAIDICDTEALSGKFCMHCVPLIVELLSTYITVQCDLLSDGWFATKMFHFDATDD